MTIRDVLFEGVIESHDVAPTAPILCASPMSCMHDKPPLKIFFARREDGFSNVIPIVTSTMEGLVGKRVKVTIEVED